MAIDFPNNPVAGNTYSYLDIQYIYRVSGDVGWWAVNTPATVGVATPDEINEGTDNAKYISPQGLEASDYVRQDEATGDTVLYSKERRRLHAHDTGVDIVGILAEVTSTGVPVAPILNDAIRTTTAPSLIADSANFIFMRVGRVVTFKWNTTLQHTVPDGYIVVNIPEGYRPIPEYSSAEHIGNLPNLSGAAVARLVTNPTNAQLTSYDWSRTGYFRVTGSWITDDA